MVAQSLRTDLELKRVMWMKWSRVLSTVAVRRACAAAVLRKDTGLIQIPAVSSLTVAYFPDMIFHEPITFIDPLTNLLAAG
ncbi:MAG: hypothetical protein FD164_1086 [Nitrospirae bacterium]|nr:MAG: hypothetical protein FD164_1086 [Nitrospirota bacterium]